MKIKYPFLQSKKDGTCHPHSYSTLLLYYKLSACTSDYGIHFDIIDTGIRLNEFQEIIVCPVFANVLRDEFVRFCMARFIFDIAGKIKLRFSKNLT